MMKKSVILSLERYVLGPIVLFFCFYTSYRAYNYIVRLTNLDVYEGKISETGIHVHPGMFGATSEVFYLKISGRPDSIVSLNLLQDYDRLTSNLHKGDLVKVYFDRTPSAKILKAFMVSVEKDVVVIDEMPRYIALKYIEVILFLLSGVGVFYVLIFVLGKPAKEFGEVANGA